MDISKLCTKCKDVKPLSAFRKQTGTKDGHKYICIPCDDKIQRLRYNRKKQEYITTVKKWQSANKEKLKAYKTKWRLKSKT